MELIEGNLLNVCGHIVKSTDIYRSLPFYWDKKCQTIVLKSHTHRLILKIFFIFCVLGFLIQFRQILSTWKEADILVFSFSVAPLSANLICLPGCYVVNFKPKLIAQLLKALCNFEKKYAQNILKPQKCRARSATGAITIFFCKALAHTPLVVTLLAAHVFINPCFPGYTGYWLVPQCRTALGFIKRNNFGSLEEFVTRFIVATLYFTLWQMMSAHSILVICLGIVIGFCIVSYIKSVYMLE